MTHDQREIHRKKRILEYAERIVNVLNMLKAEYDGLNRGLATDHRATYLFIIAGTPGFRDWWQRHRDIGRDIEFARWVDSLTKGGSEVS